MIKDIQGPFGVHIVPAVVAIIVVFAGCSPGQHLAVTLPRAAKVYNAALFYVEPGNLLNFPYPR